MSKHTAIYVRVSSKQQDHRSQTPDLQRWEESQAGPVRWYLDKASGKTMDRPGWNKLEQAIRQGKVSSVVCWRIDRLGRTVIGLSELFAELRERKINLVSLRDGLDLSTAAGRLMAHVLASVAEYERELRGEQQRAGIDRALADVRAGKRKGWGGSKRGVPKKVTPTQIKIVCQMRNQGEGVSAIARATGLSRPTLYAILRRNDEGQ
jgi:DNA invertase Pin-like site-specific DNA recombinase